jgi:pSer/pThr/pTyr-binding forkhead associated (FHA) protein
MIICPHCAHQNREGALQCESCGRGMTSTIPPARPTQKLNSESSELTARATWGTAHFEENTPIILRIRDTQDSIVLEAAKQVILGRADDSNTRQPDLDLTPYGALEQGVSRNHVMIFRSEHALTITDMSSANGTHLNGQRLVPDEPRLLRDGDEIRLGRLVAYIYFK